MERFWTVDPRPSNDMARPTDDQHRRSGRRRRRRTDYSLHVVATSLTRYYAPS